MKIQNVQWNLFCLEVMHYTQLFSSFIKCVSIQMRCHLKWKTTFLIQNFDTKNQLLQQGNVPNTNFLKIYIQWFGGVLFSFFLDMHLPAYNPPPIYKRNIGVCHTVPIIVPEYKVCLMPYLKEQTKVTSVLACSLCFPVNYLNVGSRRLKFSLMYILPMFSNSALFFFLQFKINILNKKVNLVYFCFFKLFGSALFQF